MAGTLEAGGSRDRKWGRNEQWGLRQCCCSAAAHLRGQDVCSAFLGRLEAGKSMKCNNGIAHGWHRSCTGESRSKETYQTARVTCTASRFSVETWALHLQDLDCVVLG